MPATWEHDDGQQLVEPGQVCLGAAFRWFPEVPRTGWSSAASFGGHPDPEPIAHVPQPNASGLQRCIPRIQRRSGATTSQHGTWERFGAPVRGLVSPRLGRTAEKPPAFNKSRKRRSRPRQNAGEFLKLLPLLCAPARLCLSVLIPHQFNTNTPHVSIIAREKRVTLQKAALYEMGERKPTFNA